MLLFLWLRRQSIRGMSRNAKTYEKTHINSDKSVISYLKIFLCVYFIVIEPPQNPCIPSPCGPYSQCNEVNSHAVCSCVPNYIGTPPACRPECTSSSECSLDRACINQKCVDPCPGTCGVNARCHVTNHNPICSCSPSFTGDPFIRCLPEESKRCLSIVAAKRDL